MGPAVFPVQRLNPIAQRTIVDNIQFFQTTPAGPGGTGVKSPLVTSPIGNGSIYRLRHGYVDATVVPALKRRREIDVGGVSFKLIVHLGAVTQSPAEAVGHIDQYAEVEAIGAVIPFDTRLGIFRTGQSGVCQRVTGQFTVNLVDSGTEADRYTIIDPVADSRLQSGYLNLAVQAMIPALERLLIIADHPERNIESEAEMPLFVNRAHVIGERNYRVGGNIALIGAGAYIVSAGSDICLGPDGSNTTADLRALQA